MIQGGLRCVLLHLGNWIKQLLSDVTNESEDEQVVFASYLSQISELLICSELLSLHWHRYADHLHEVVASQAYVTPSIQSPTSHQGRPKLEITRDQLLYLSSLSLSWSDLFCKHVGCFTNDHLAMQTGVWNVKWGNWKSREWETGREWERERDRNDTE